MVQSILSAYRGMTVQESKVEASSRRISGAQRPAEPATPNGSTPSEGVSDHEIQGAVEFLLNVDLTKEMVNIEVAKRAYEANARVIKASNEMLEKALDLDI